MQRTFKAGLAVFAVMLVLTGCGAKGKEAALAPTGGNGATTQPAKSGTDAATGANGQTQTTQTQTGQTQTTPASETSNIKPDAPMAFRMIDAHTGWAIATNGILRTTDGGSHWTDVTPPAYKSSPDNAYAFVDTVNAYVTPLRGESRQMYRTTDGGKTWNASDLPARGKPLQFVDATHGYFLVHDNGAGGNDLVSLYGTTDGGGHWTKVSTTGTPGNLGKFPFEGQKTGVSFKDNTTGFATGYIRDVEGQFYLYRTQDGGKTWQKQDVPLPDALKQQVLMTQPPLFLPGGDVLPVMLKNLNSGKQSLMFFQSRNGGQTWESTVPLNLQNQEGSVAYDFADAEHGVVVDGDKLYTTSDGGTYWNEVQTDDTFKQAFGAIKEVQWLTAQEGYVLVAQPVKGTSDLLKTTDGGQTWKKI